MFRSSSPHHSAVIEVVEERRDERSAHLSRTQHAVIELAGIVNQPEHMEHVAEVVVRVAEILRMMKERARVVDQVSFVQLPVVADGLGKTRCQLLVEHAQFSCNISMDALVPSGLTLRRLR
jgi:hypothetical protein